VANVKNTPENKLFAAFLGWCTELANVHYEAAALTGLSYAAIGLVVEAMRKFNSSSATRKAREAAARLSVRLAEGIVKGASPPWVGGLVCFRFAKYAVSDGLCLHGRLLVD